MLNVFPALPIVIVLSHMPGKVAIKKWYKMMLLSSSYSVVTAEPLWYVKLPTISKTDKSFPSVLGYLEPLPSQKIMSNFFISSKGSTKTGYCGVIRHNK